jgi:hypothetical protein
MRGLTSAVGSTLLRQGGGTLAGAVGGGVSNALYGGDMDHAIRGAVVGGVLGSVPGLMLRNSNPLLRLGLAGAIPAALAAQKDRPMLQELFSPGHDDMLSNLYSAERAFQENSPEWNEYYQNNPDAYAARYEKQAASMSLDDIAYMEEMSGSVVGRTRTKVGTIVDSNGKYTLYDDTGKYTYGDFTKLSSAIEHSEKVAAWWKDKYTTTSDSIRRQKGGWLGRGNSEVVGKLVDGKVINQGSHNLHNTSGYMGAADKLTNQAGKTQALQQELAQSQTLQKTTQAELAAAQQEATKATQRAARYGKVMKGVGAVGVLGGLGYLGYQYFKPDSWQDRMSNAASSAVKKTQQYMPHISGALNAYNQSGGAGMMGYAANQGAGQYQQIPQNNTRRY